ncbi:MAG: hypothetical protein ACREDH_14610, partial [Methylocella sp.]
LRHVFGMSSACLRHVFGMSSACLRHVFGMSSIADAGAADFTIARRYPKAVTGKSRPPDAALPVPGRRLIGSRAEAAWRKAMGEATVAVKSLARRRFRRRCAKHAAVALPRPSP